jgi:hypothetical protein
VHREWRRATRNGARPAHWDRLDPGGAVRGDSFFFCGPGPSGSPIDSPAGRRSSPRRSPVDPRGG